MKRLLLGAGVVGLAAIGGFYWLNDFIRDEELGGVEDYRSVEFRMSGEPVTLVDGEARTDSMMGAASATVVRYFGAEAEGDLNGDGAPDMAFLVTQDAGGSGTFFYAVGAIQNDAGRYHGTQAVLIGDRITPRSVEVQDGRLVVHFLERAPGAPMVEEPSVETSMVLRLDPQTFEFGEVVQDFEGEEGMGAHAPRGSTSRYASITASSPSSPRRELPCSMPRMPV